MMSRVLGMCVVVAWSMLAGGCGSPLLHSGAAGGTPYADAGLTGTWLSAEDLTIGAEIKAEEGVAGAASAVVTVKDKDGKKSKVLVDVMLFDVGGTRCADLFLARPDRDRLVEGFGFLAVPVHQVVRLERDGDTLSVRMLRTDWLRNDDAVGKSYAHEKVAVGGGELVMLTGNSEQVRDFIAKHGKRAEAWGEALKFKRVK